MVGELFGDAALGGLDILEHALPEARSCEWVVDLGPTDINNVAVDELAAKERRLAHGRSGLALGECDGEAEGGAESRVDDGVGALLWVDGEPVDGALDDKSERIGHLGVGIVPDVAADKARVDAVADDVSVVVRARQALLELDGPHEEPELRVAVQLHATGAHRRVLLVVHVGKVEHATVVEDGACVDDARRTSILHGRQDVEGEEAVREKVDHMRQLESLVCDASLAGREASIVDQDVTGATGRTPLLSKTLNVGERRAVDLPQLDLGIVDAGGLDDLLACLLRILLVRGGESTRHDHRRARLGKVQSSLLADARVAARDDHRLACGVVVGAFGVREVDRTVDIAAVLAQRVVARRPLLCGRQQARTIAARVKNRGYRNHRGRSVRSRGIQRVWVEERRKQSWWGPSFIGEVIKGLERRAGLRESRVQQLAREEGSITESKRTKGGSHGPDSGSAVHFRKHAGGDYRGSFSGNLFRKMRGSRATPLGMAKLASGCVALIPKLDRRWRLSICLMRPLKGSMKHIGLGHSK
ncbi:hypothetical protein L1887_54134 [Cichorium endivia]|nr:hypothetical protein L1887_54134 [Cichorium endivia]